MAAPACKQASRLCCRPQHGTQQRDPSTPRGPVTSRQGSSGFWRDDGDIFLATAFLCPNKCDVDWGEGVVENVAGQRTASRCGDELLAYTGNGGLSSVPGDRPLAATSSIVALLL